MNYNRVAFRYAKALLLSCKDDNDKLEAVHNDMSFINNTFDESEELKLFIDSKVIKDSDKLATLNEIFEDINVLYNDYVGNQEVTLTTASEVEFEKLKEIEQKVKELTSKNVNLTNIVDKQIVGGFVLRVGDLQYNASFKDQLKKLEQEFLNITIQ